MRIYISMRDYVLMTDSDTEIPYWFADKHDLPVFLMPYAIDGKEALFDLGRNTDFRAFYQAIRSGAEATTATRPPADIQAFFEDILKQGKDILYICFSSQLSAHYELSQVAREAALANYPDARIEVYDSKRIAMGAGLLVYHAVKQREAGASMDELISWLDENVPRALEFFTVDSLMYLKRTGRLSAVTATLGTILDLKPVLTLMDDGKIVAFDKVKGRRKIVKYLSDKIEEYIDDSAISHDLLVVYHADSPELADALLTDVKSRYSFSDIWLMDVGPVIGAHCGPGTLAICMMGKARS